MGSDERGDAGTLTMAHSAAPPAPVPALIRAVGGDVLRLGAGSCKVGADPSCDLVVSHRTVSRVHAELTLRPEGVEVRDLGSRNGTFYLGQRIESITLALGARVMLGGAELVIEPDLQALQDDLDYRRDSYRGMVAHSPAMRRVFALLARLEGSLATVLIDGESGVGKELVAQAVHQGSVRAKGPFVAVNCGAVSRELVGSELFGHERGAFSGAVASRKGAFQQAHGGTLFLDELGELPADVQPVLLRALETGEVKPLGADQVVRVSVRVVAATNRDLEHEVEAGNFRSDLFYRLAVVRLSIPPLRERRDDIEPLARTFAADAGLDELPSEVIEHFKLQPWLGNARELRNAVESFAALRVLPRQRARRTKPAADATIASFVDVDRPYLEARDELVEAFSRQYLETLLERAGHNQTRAAKLAGLDRKYLARLLERYGLR